MSGLLDNFLDDSDEDDKKPISAEETNRLLTLLNDENNDMDVSDIIDQLENYDNKCFNELDSFDLEQIDMSITPKKVEEIIPKENEMNDNITIEEKDNSMLEWAGEIEGGDELVGEESMKNINTSIENVVYEEVEESVIQYSSLSQGVWSCGYTAESVGCVSQITSQSLQPGNVYHLGTYIIQVADRQMFEYTLRPDVNSSIILNLAEQVFLSYGGTSVDITTDNKPANNKMTESLRSTRLQISFAKNVQNEIDSIDAYLGVNIFKRRVFVIVINPTKGTLFQSKAMSNQSVSNLVSSIYVALSSAFHSEQLTIAYLLQDTVNSQSHNSGSSAMIDSMCDNKHNYMENKRNNSETMANISVGNHLPALTPLDSVVDPEYICDVIHIFANDIEADINILMQGTLSYIQKLEKNCARLMTLLKPQYILSQLVMPTPPTKAKYEDLFYSHSTDNTSPSHASSNFSTLRLPNNLSDKKVILEFCKFLIFRARREYLRNKNTALSSEQTSIQSVYLKCQYEELEEIIKYIFTQLHEIYINEAKLQHIPKRCIYLAYRIQQIEQYKSSIIDSLASRQMKSLEDTAQFKSLQTNFRIVSEKEPILIEMRASMSGGDGLTPSMVNAISGGRIGTLHMTSTHIYFFSNALMFMNAIQKIIPINTISTMSVIPATLIATEAVSITDKGGNVTVFYPTAVEPNYASRFMELVKYIIQNQVENNSNINVASKVYLDPKFIRIVAELANNTNHKETTKYTILQKDKIGNLNDISTRTDISYLIPKVGNDVVQNLSALDTTLNYTNSNSKEDSLTDKNVTPDIKSPPKNELPVSQSVGGQKKSQLGKGIQAFLQQQQSSQRPT